MAEVVLRNIVKRYGAVEAVRGIDLHIEDRELVALVGPSGCGKSTTLRMIAGLESISSGDILIGNSIVNEIPPKRRDIAMVFQSYALYPHMTVYSNMSFGLRMRSFSKDEIRRRVADAARILDIEELLDRRPGQLSGGQRQRVAMGRAIVRDPQVFLFDEPLSNLDAKLRVQMRTEIKRVHQKVQTTTIYVTHDQVEAMTLADKVVVMNKGLIEQVGSPHEVYHAPRTRFVAGFMGSPSMNFIDCQLVANGSALSVVLGDGTSLPVPTERTGRYKEWVGKDLEFGIRPEHISGLHGTAARKNTTKLAVKPDVIEPTGMETMVFFSLDGTEICARVDPETPLQLGEESHLSINMAQMHLIDKATGNII